MDRISDQSDNAIRRTSAPPIPIILAIWLDPPQQFHCPSKSGIDTGRKFDRPRINLGPYRPFLSHHGTCVVSRKEPGLVGGLPHLRQEELIRVGSRSLGCVGTSIRTNHVQKELQQLGSCLSGSCNRKCPKGFPIFSSAMLADNLREGRLPGFYNMKGMQLCGP